MKRLKEWLRLQLSKQPIPYSLCQKPIEALTVLQALRERAEQQALHQALGLEQTAQGVAVPAPSAA
ncbi:hypothetical protein [Hymenobacter sp. BT559]|uniref:hypothetical protein n=1 Tax=Hymenobacter sp. BT559 TaxID=2795729 RepID=UPI0018EE1469|nr:hypothetical protein [Hymenobacter sp. BT559]